MAEQATIDLAKHLEALRHGAGLVIRKARMLAARSTDSAALRVLMEDQTFKQLVADLDAANRWVAEQAVRTGAATSKAAAEWLAQQSPPTQTGAAI